MADSIISHQFDGYKAYSNDVIHFKLVRNESDLDDENNIFKPDMSHQLFGDSESIFGYKDLRIDIYCTAARMITYINITYSDKITPQKCDGVSADDIVKILAEKLQPGFLTKLDDFVVAVGKDASFRPYGDLVHSYTVTKVGEERRFEIYRTDMMASGFRDYHERLQPFLLFYVDAASYIDVDDERWNYFLVFEKYKTSGSTAHAFVGYMTVYNYYAYPEMIRPRISQVLVMPPFQRQGHCATLVQCFYNICYARTDILDITVEDPSEGFQRVRDYVDTRNCMKLPSYHPARLAFGFTDSMAEEARQKLKLNKKQARRAYEILRLKVTDCFNTTQFKQYRLDVKKRLNIPFQKNGRDFEKLQRALKPNELSATLNVSNEQRMECLEKQFQESVNEYRVILERIELEY